MRLSLVVVAVGLLGSGVSAQQVVSAHAGVVHYIEGTVLVGGQKVVPKFGRFPDLRDGRELRTEDGRAEVLLTPGAFLRVADHSSVRMLSSDLSNVRFEVLTGTAMVECDELLKNNALTLVYENREIRIEKQGIYRLDTAPPRFRVYEGKAVAQSGADRVTLGNGKEASLEGLLVATKFDRKHVDDFYAWNSERAGYIAAANISSARSLRSSGTAWTSSGWQWDPWFGAYAFIPGSGVGFSPFGWDLWSPGWVTYAPPILYGGGYGYGVWPGYTGRQSSGGGTVAPGGNGSSAGKGGVAGQGTPPAGTRPALTARSSGGTFVGSGFSGGGYSGGGFSGASSSGGGFSSGRTGGGFSSGGGIGAGHAAGGGHAGR